MGWIDTLFDGPEYEYEPEPECRACKGICEWQWLFNVWRCSDCGETWDAASIEGADYGY
jgi:hypothetical protein